MLHHLLLILFLILGGLRQFIKKKVVLDIFSMELWMQKVILQNYKIIHSQFGLMVDQEAHHNMELS